MSQGVENRGSLVNVPLPLREGKGTRTCCEYSAKPLAFVLFFSRAAKRGAFKRGGFPMLGDSSGIFPICPFPLSRPKNSAYEEQSRKGPRHNPDLSRKKKVGNPPVWQPPSLACLSFLSRSFHVSEPSGESGKRKAHKPKKTVRTAGRPKGFQKL